MTHDEKIVEAVACAIFHARPRNRIWDALPNEFKNQYRKQARAAITAYQAEAAKVAETLDEADPAGRITAAIETKTARDDWWDKPGESLSEDPDAAFNQVKAFALCREFIRTQDLQRHFQIGFNRAAGYAGRMEDAGLISKWDAEIEGRYVLKPLPNPPASP